MLPVTREFTFVAFDFETTGLSPSKDRVLEIGCVKFNREFQIVDEWETLVNPKRDVGRTDIHGITPKMLLEAPTFEEIAASFAKFLDGSILVAHNKGFDLRFLCAEFARLGIESVDPDALCTMELFRSSFPRGPRQLGKCCEFLGINVVDAHQALSDARMSASIAIHILKNHGYPAVPSPVEFSEMIGVTSVAIPRPRQSVAIENSGDESFISELVERLPSQNVVGRSAITSAEYLNLLDEVLSDRMIDRAETESLFDLASELGLTRMEIESLHSSYLYNLCSVALRDDVLTTDELLDIHKVAEMLGIAEWRSVLDIVLNSAHKANSKDPLIGLRICFTGTMQMARAEIEEIASSRGMIVVGTVSKKVDFLVVADPFTQSTKARKARECGTQIVSERAFMDLVGSF